MSHFAYHCTQIDPDIIKKEGFMNSDAGFTAENQFDGLYRKYLPKFPCFISDENARVWDSNSKYCIKIDITSFELFPDYGHLLDIGAYYDEPDESDDILFWWSDDDLVQPNKNLAEYPKMIEYLRQHNGYMNSSDFTGSMSLELIGTACIDGMKITSKHIVDIRENKAQINEELSRSESSKLRRKMKNGIVSFSYKKKSTGKVRQANGTLKKNLMPKFKIDKQAIRKPGFFTYWDIGRKEFRCFSRENYIGINKDNVNLSSDSQEKDLSQENK